MKPESWTPPHLRYPSGRSSCLLGLLLCASVATASGSADTTENLGIPPLQSGQDFSATDPQLDRLIQELIEQNPQIRSGWARTQAGLHRIPQASSLPDPQFSYRYYAQPTETRVGPMEHGFEISQGIPWRNKRGLQAQRAERETSSTAWQVRDLERSLIADLQQAYFEAAYLQEALTVNSEERDLLRRFESIALRRYATGGGIQQNVIRVQTEISRLDDRETALQKALEAVLRRIAEVIGQPESALQLEPIALSLTESRFDTAVLEQMALEQHPQIHGVRARIDADRLWSQRRRLESRPDFRFGLGYTIVGDRTDTAGVMNPPQDNGQDVLALTVGINLPVYRKRIRAGVAEAEQNVRASERLLDATENRIRYEIQEAVLRLESFQERGRLYDEVIVPQAEESLASAEAAYTTNKLPILDLLDAERILFQSRLAYHRLVADYWISLADLEYAVGRAIPRRSAAAASPEEGRS